jgi:putative ABC transport system permease protein
VRRVLRGLLSRALRGYPRDFRRRYAEEIIGDIDEEPERLTYHIIDIWKGALAMRVENFVRDVAYAAARLRRTPFFVAIVTLMFALGIGANVAVFSAFNAMVLQPLPFPAPQRLVAISKQVEGRGAGGPLSELDVSDLRSMLHGVTSLAGVAGAQATLVADGVPKGLHGAAVSTPFFRTIGAVPLVGRFFGSEDGREGRHSIVISARLWRTYFQADPAIAGKPIRLDSTSYSIIGVAPDGLQAPMPWGGTGGTLAQPDYFTAMADSSPSYRRGVGGTVGAIARLAPGTTVASLNAELQVASEHVRGLYPRSSVNDKRITFQAQPLADQLIGPVASSLWMVLLAVFGTLLVACANVANLIATRWSAREREIAVRRALGASAAQIAGQLFVETGILSLLGGIAGVLLALVCLRVVPLTALSGMPRVDAIGIDGWTLLYALGMVCLTTVLAGLAPVLSLGRSNLYAVLSSAGRSGDTSRGNRLRTALVIAEVAVAFALVISSGLLLRSFLSVIDTPLGIRTDGVYETASLRIPAADFEGALGLVGVRESNLVRRLQSVPGIDAAAIALTFPMLPSFGYYVPQVSGAPCSPQQGPYATRNDVSPDYFRALGIVLRRGRAFGPGDVQTSAPVAVVSQDFADTFMRGRDPIGQTVRTCGFADKPATVVGVVATVKQQLGMSPLPVVYSPAAQVPLPAFAVVVHAPHTDLPAMRGEIQSAFAAVFPTREPPDVFTVSSAVASVTAPQRSATALLGSLAVVSLLLALSGIFGVVSFQVGQRLHEFGIRIALGATAPRIIGGVLRRSFSVIGIGLAIGTILIALDARQIAPYLTVKSDILPSAVATPQLVVSPFDPLTFVVVVALIIGCGAIAALIPAVRATRVDPAIALRYE